MCTEYTHFVCESAVFTLFYSEYTCVSVCVRAFMCLHAYAMYVFGKSHRHTHKNMAQKRATVYGDYVCASFMRVASFHSMSLSLCAFAVCVSTFSIFRLLFGSISLSRFMNFPNLESVFSIFISRR